MTDAATRRYTISYIIALSLIGLIALTTHVIVDRMASHQQIFAAEINFAGRQRMLVQQAARKAVEFSTTDAAMRPGIILQMSRAIDELEQSHKALISGDSLEGIELYQSQNVDHLYFGPPQNRTRDTGSAGAGPGNGQGSNPATGSFCEWQSGSKPQYRSITL